MIIKPPYLKTGDKIGIVSTASRIDQNMVLPAVELLESSGYKVEIGKYTFSQYNQFSAKDEERASDLQKMIDNKDIKAIICTRGGYGSLRTAELTDWSSIQNFPKWIVGFSDTTVLHSKLNKLRIASIHGVMPRYFLEEGQPSQSFKYLIDLLTGKSLEYNLPAYSLNREGKAKGEVVGGNLSMLYSLRGTSYDIKTKGKILFIEDLDEYLYHIDRMMMNLKVGDKLSQLEGLIVGNFTGMKDNNTPFGKSVEEIILDSVKEYDFPVIFNFPSGHTKDNFALKLGIKTRITVGEKSVSVRQK